MNHEHHEQLSEGGVANATDDDDATSVRIIPIPEGEQTVGQSGEPTVWDREPMRAAVESGVIDGSKIVKGEGGKNPHFPFDEQVPPENILGRVDSWTYEDGVGPVGKADIVDEQMAKRIDAGLLEVSPDILRDLDDFDEERGAKPVKEILGMPRITVLDQGASQNASIEPSMAEALGYNPDGQRRVGEDGGDEQGEQLSPLYPLRFHGYGEFVGTEFIDEAATNLNAIQGVTAVRSSDTEDPELIAVLDRSSIEMDGLNQSIIDALDDTPFEVFEGFDWIERIGREQLAQRGGLDSDEAAESATGDSPANTDTESELMDEPTKEELREQLAAAKAEVEQKEEELNDTEETLEELESEKEDLESTVESKDERIETLESDTEHARRRLALEATGGNESAADMLVESDKSMDDLAASAADANDNIEVDDDDDRSFVEQVEEQLAASPAARGQPDGTDDGTPGGQPSEEQLANANDWAYEALSGNDISRVSQEEQLSPRSLAEQKTGVDPAECDSRQEFVRRVEAAKDGGDN